MIEQLQLSKSGYYRWCQHPTSIRERRQNQLDQLISQIFVEHKSRYGATRIKEELSDHYNISVKRQTVSNHMRRLGLIPKARRKFKVTTDSNHKKPVAPNILNQDFSANAPNEKWVTDITYMRLLQTEEIKIVLTKI